MCTGMASIAAVHAFLFYVWGWLDVHCLDCCDWFGGVCAGCVLPVGVCVDVHRLGYLSWGWWCVAYAVVMDAIRSKMLNIDMGYRKHLTMLSISLYDFKLWHKLACRFSAQQPLLQLCLQYRPLLAHLAEDELQAEDELCAAAEGC